MMEGNFIKVGIQDFPMEVTQMILQELTTCKERNKARLVCSTWLYALNSDSSTERFNVTKNFNHLWRIPKGPFTDIIEILLESNRRGICYDFRVDSWHRNDLLQQFRTLFELRGEQIDSLCISLNPRDIDPLELLIVSENCPNLETITLKVCCPTTLNAKKMINLKDCGVTFPSVRSVIVEKVNLNNFVFEAYTFIEDILIMFPNCQSVELFGQLAMPVSYWRFKSYPLNQNVRIVLHEVEYKKDDPLFEKHTDVITYGNMSRGEPTVYNMHQLYVQMVETVPDEYEMNSIFYVTSVEELMELLRNSCSLKTLKLLFDSVTGVITFPFRENGKEIFMKQLEILYIDGGEVILNNKSDIFEHLDQLTLVCDVVGFDTEIIKKLTNLVHLKLSSIPYEIFVIICDKLCNLQFLTIENITNFDVNTIGSHKQRNLEKLKKLKFMCIPYEIGRTETYLE